MSALTEEQKRKMADREAKAERIASGASGQAPEGEPVPLSVVMGGGPPVEGERVRIGGADYEITPFPLGRLAEASRLVDACPDMLKAAALAGSTDVEQVAQMMARLAAMAGGDAGKTAETLTPELVEQAFASVAFNITDEQAGAMVDLVVLALSRRHPDLTRADIEDEIDLEAFLPILITIMAKNRALKRRF